MKYTYKDCHILSTYMDLCLFCNYEYQSEVNAAINQIMRRHAQRNNSPMTLIAHERSIMLKTPEFVDMELLAHIDSVEQMLSGDL